MTAVDAAWQKELHEAVRRATEAGQVMKAPWMISLVRRHRPELSEREAAELACTALRQWSAEYTAACTPKLVT